MLGEFEKKKVKRHSALMKKASEEALTGSIWGSPYLSYDRYRSGYVLISN